MTTTNNTNKDDERLQDEALYTRQIDDVLFQIDGAGGLAFIDLRDGDEARLVSLDTRQHRALATFYRGIMRDARRERDKRVVDMCLAMIDNPAA